MCILYTVLLNIYIYFIKLKSFIILIIIIDCVVENYNTIIKKIS